MRMAIFDKINLDSIRSTRNPISSAAGMPNAAYTDLELFHFERDSVLSKTWAGLEFTSELPQPGYAIPIDFMGIPLVVVRDHNDEIRVFHNVCSHRGMVVVNQAGPIKKLLRCPYHSWTYDLKGSLKSTPHIGGVGQNKVTGFDCGSHGLKNVSSECWMGIVFINLSGNAMPFAEFIEPLKTRWEAFTGQGQLDQVVVSTHSKMQIEIKANWKLAIENYCEAYHLPWVHPDLNSYSHLEEHVNLHINEYMTGQGTLNYTLSKVAGTTLPKFEFWPEDKMTEGEYISLYPNLMLGVQVDHVFAIILHPQAPDHTVEKLQISYVNETAADPKFEGCRAATMQAWKTVFEEDISAVEGMQRGRHSPGFAGGAFSPVLDPPSHDFHKWVAIAYEKALINGTHDEQSE